MAVPKGSVAKKGSAGKLQTKAQPVKSAPTGSTKSNKAAAPALEKGKKRERDEVVSKTIKGDKKSKKSETVAAPAAAESEDEDEEDNEDLIKLPANSKGRDSEEEADSEDDEDDEDYIRGLSDVSGSDSGADSSDDDDDDDDGGSSLAEISTSGVVRLPSSKNDAVVKAKLDKVAERKKKQQAGGKAQVASTPSVVYFGRLPRWMTEEPLRGYLTQFGDIRRLRLSRNRRTGASKHYAFVEFDDEDVGRIVAETMDNYILENRMLQARVVPKDKVHPKMWVGAKQTFKPVRHVEKQQDRHNAVRSQEEREKAERKLLERQAKKKDSLKQQGIDYDFEGYVS